MLHSVLSNEALLSRPVFVRFVVGYMEGEVRYRAWGIADYFGRAHEYGILVDWVNTAVLLSLDNRWAYLLQ